MQVAVALALARVLVVAAVQQSQKSNEQHLPPELQKLWRLFQKNNCHVMALQIIKKLYVMVYGGAMEPLLEIKGLNVDINGLQILNLREQTITIQEGDIVGIIGENGAGKSTFINCLIDKINYKGKIVRNYSLDKLGIQFQTNNYNKLMKVFELIQIISHKSKFDSSLKSQIDKFDITELLNKRIEKLSIGEQQRLTLFLVLYLNPEILIFDELTTGLDYKKRTKILDIVKTYSQGKTVLTVTHYYEELNDWVNKILILHKGDLVFWGTFDNLKETFKHYSIVTLSTDDFYNLPKELKNINTVSLDDKTCGLIVADEYHQEEILRSLSRSNIRFQINPNSIYNLYMLAMKNFIEKKEA